MPLSAVVAKPRRERLKASEVPSYNPLNDDFTAIPDSYWTILRRPVKAEGCKQPKAPLDTPLQRDLVLYIGHLLWRGNRRQKPTWTELLDGAKLARMLDCSTRALIEVVDDLVARGVMAAQTEEGRRGYQYTLLVANWRNVKPRPDPPPLPDPPPTTMPEGEEKENEQLPPVHCLPDSRIVVLPGRTRTITLGQSVRETGKTEIRNELATAQVETWEDSGVFRIRVAAHGEDPAKQRTGGNCSTISPPAASNGKLHRVNVLEAKANGEPQKLELYDSWRSLREQCPKPINITLDSECRKIFLAFPLTTCERILEDTSIRISDWNRPGKNLDFVPDGAKYLKSKIWDTDPVQRVQRKTYADDQIDEFKRLRRQDREKSGHGIR